MLCIRFFADYVKRFICSFFTDLFGKTFRFYSCNWFQSGLHVQLFNMAKFSTYRTRISFKPILITGVDSPFELQANRRSQLGRGGCCYDRQSLYVGIFSFLPLLEWL